MSIGRKIKRKKNTSSLNEHKRYKKKLIPPLKQLSGLKTLSWRDDKMPEYLWVGLLLKGMKRDKVIYRLKEIVKYWMHQPKKLCPTDISFTALSRIPYENQKQFINTFFGNGEEHISIQPLQVLLENLPGHKAWKEVMDRSNFNNDKKEQFWLEIGNVVLEGSDHQSELSTDCRWFRVLYFTLGIKKLIIPVNIIPVDNIINYPYHGELRSVRPVIRAMEIGIPFEDNTLEWTKKFWEICMKHTKCIPIKIYNNNGIKNSITLEDTSKLIDDLKKHWDTNVNDTDLNPKRDAIYGNVFYCVSILEELLKSENAVSIVGRLGLRAIVESYITLAYLIKKDEDNLWKEYRNYGVGQIKLATLKLDEKVENVPSSVNVEYLNQLINEDHWEEFTSINMGNWNSKTLRNISDEAGLLEVYNKFYDWTSSFVHGNWGAIREAVFVTCVNPLHRFHRIPDKRQTLNDVINDAADLINNMLNLLDGEYHGFKNRLKLK